MRTTAILNLKGGVGKTTTVIHMASILHRDYGARVLVVDCDHQHNLTQFLEADAKKGSTTKVLTMGWHDGVSTGLIQQTGTEGVDILAADDSLMAFDLTQLKTDNAKSYCFRMMVLELGRLESYDYVLFDCPPAFNAACAAALIAADDVVIPIELDAFSVAGMANIIQQVENMRRLNNRLRVAGVLPTKWYKDDTIMDAESILRQSSLNVFHRIRYSKRMAAVTFARELGSRKTAPMRDYRLFVGQYVKKSAGVNIDTSARKEKDHEQK